MKITLDRYSKPPVMSLLAETQAESCQLREIASEFAGMSDACSLYRLTDGMGGPSQLNIFLRRQEHSKPDKKPRGIR